GVGRNHADGTMVEAEALGHAALHDVRHLGRADEREKTQPGVPMGEDAAAFQREHAVARGADFARDLDGSGFGDALDRTILGKFDEDVVAHPSSTSRAWGRRSASLATT